VGITYITPDYFNVMSIPLLDGRAIAASDPTSGPATAIIVNQSFVDHYLAGRNPIGAAQLEHVYFSREAATGGATVGGGGCGCN
jgi:hypothetical protein